MKENLRGKSSSARQTADPLDFDYRPLMAAVVKVTVTDLLNTNLPRQLDAILFVTSDDFDFYADVCGVDVEGVKFLTSGRARQAAKQLRKGKDAND